MLVLIGHTPPSPVTNHNIHLQRQKKSDGTAKIITVVKELGGKRHEAKSLTVLKSEAEYARVTKYGNNMMAFYT